MSDTLAALAGGLDNRQDTDTDTDLLWVVGTVADKVVGKVADKVADKVVDKVVGTHTDTVVGTVVVAWGV